MALWVPRSNTILSSFTPSICISYVKVVPGETRGNKILPSFTLIVCASPMGVVPAITRRYTFQSFFSPSICVSHIRVVTGVTRHTTIPISSNESTQVLHYILTTSSYWSNLRILEQTFKHVLSCVIIWNSPIHSVSPSLYMRDVTWVTLGNPGRDREA